MTRDVFPEVRGGYQQRNAMREVRWRWRARGAISGALGIAGLREIVV